MKEFGKFMIFFLWNSSLKRKTFSNQTTQMCTTVPLIGVADQHHCVGFTPKKCHDESSDQYGRLTIMASINDFW